MNDILSDAQKNYGQRKYMLFSTFNGFSVALLAEGTLILYALKIGIPDYIVGVISSFLFLGMPFIFIGKNMVSMIGLSKTVAIAWFMRSLSMLLAAATPFAIYYTSSLFGMVLVLLASFGYYALRGVGGIGWTPILGEITSENDRGRYSSRIFQNFNAAYFFGVLILNFNAAYFFGVLILMIVLEFWDSIETFQIVICVGCLFGFISAYNVLQVPESSTPKISASVSIRGAVIYLLNYPEGRKLVWVQTIYFIGVTLTLPYSMLALKEGYHIQDYKAMQFMLIQLVGAVVVSITCKKMIDKIGSRKIIISLFFLMIIVSSMWALSPASFSLGYNSVIFILLGAAQMGGYLTLITYFLNIIPAQKRVGATLIITIVSSFIAGVFGAVVGAGLLKLLESLSFNSLSLFQGYFTIIVLIQICCFLLILKLEQVNVIKIGKKLILKYGLN